MKTLEVSEFSQFIRANAMFTLTIGALCEELLVGVGASIIIYLCEVPKVCC